MHYIKTRLAILYYDRGLSAFWLGFEKKSHQIFSLFLMIFNNFCVVETSLKQQNNENSLRVVTLPDP